MWHLMEDGTLGFYKKNRFTLSPLRDLGDGGLLFFPDMFCVEQNDATTPLVPIELTTPNKQNLFYSIQINTSRRIVQMVCTGNNTQN